MPLKQIIQLFRKPQFWLLAILATTLAIAVRGLNLQAVLHPGWLWFNLTNYAFGVTQISLKNYSLGSLGILPGTFLYTYMGSLSSELTTPDLSTSSMPLSLKIAQWGLRLVGLAATLMITLYINRIAKKALNQRLVSEPSTHPLPSKMIP
jgi:hypothetical protein